MVEGAGSLDANAAWHCASLSAGVSFVRKCCLTPIFTYLHESQHILLKEIGINLLDFISLLYRDSYAVINHELSQLESVD